MPKTPLLAALVAASLAAAAPASSAQRADLADAAGPKQRLIVLTDIEADPDDTQSLVRLLLYANEIDIEGLVATTSVWLKQERHPESIRSIIDEYGKVRSNLLLHSPGYPTTSRLLSLVSEGQPGYGMGEVGAGKDSAGADLIIRSLESSDPRPLWITAWGGVNTLAQALVKMRDTKSPEELERLVAKLRVHTISDQDDSGTWIRRNFPDLFYIFSPGRYANGTWTAIHTVVDGIDNRTISNQWLADHIQQDHGPLGAAYPDVAWGMEGDTPSYLNLIPNGLNEPEHPEFGGWGGRYELYLPDVKGAGTAMVEGDIPIVPETRPVWTNAVDTLSPHGASDYGRAVKPNVKSFSDNRVTLWRWRDDFQNDFAARIGWTTLPFDQANHAPVPRLAHADHLTVRAGETFRLSAAGSSDPDGDSLSYLWFHYPEAGSWKPPITATPDNTMRVSLRAPEVTKSETAHFILKVTDKGAPALTRYKRVVVTIVPRS